MSLADRLGSILTRSMRSATDSTPKSDLDRAFQALSNKLSLYNTLWDYYDGDQPLMYTSKRMAELFDDLDLSKFVENWCAVIIDSATDRIILKSIAVKNAEAQARLTDNWEDLSLAIEASDTHEAALVIGESYIIVWAETNKDDDDELQVFYNDPRLCHLFYEPSNPHKKRYGAKWFVDMEDHVRLTLYYPDRLEYYRTRKAGKQIKDYRSFVKFAPVDGGEASAENPWKEIPFFHFRLERRKVKSDLTNVIPMQNGINKLVTDMMVAAEFGAFPQRWVISNADIKALKNAPSEVWGIPAGDGTGQSASAGQFDAADLGNYIKAIDSLAAAAAIIGRTPKHYLYGQKGELSGEALIAMEAPLNKRCTEHIDQFIPVWRDVARFMLKVQGITAEKRDITATFAKPETVQPLTEGKIRESGRRVGIPLKTLLRDEGKDEAWIEQMGKDKKEAEKASPMVALLGEMRKNQSEDDEDKDEDGEGGEQ